MCVHVTVGTFGGRDGLDKEEQQVVETLKAMDLNGDNEISIKELVQMGNVIRKGKEESARLKKIISIISVLSVFALGMLLCIVVAGVEATKESHTSKTGSPTLIDNEGKVIGTASAQNIGPLRSDLPFDTLAAMTTLRLVSEPGNVTHFFKISGFERDPTGLLTLYTLQAWRASRRAVVRPTPISFPSGYIHFNTSRLLLHHSLVLLCHLSHDGRNGP